MPEIAERASEAGEYYASSVNPIFKVTCQCSILPSSMYPRVSVTSNHRMLRIVLLARDRAL